jgi:very-short-patch-repair endonuclease
MPHRTYTYKPTLKPKSRDLRTLATRPENILWYELLKNKQMGYRFLRQKPVGNYILDFYCPKLKLAIELDGYSHEERVVYDTKRTFYLESIGIKVIRYLNHYLTKAPEYVAADLSKQIEMRKNELKIE